MTFPARSIAAIAEFFNVLRDIAQAAEINTTGLAGGPVSVQALLDYRRTLLVQKSYLTTIFQNTPNATAIIRSRVGDNSYNVVSALQGIAGAIDNVVSAINAVVPIHTANGKIYPLSVTATSSGMETPLLVQPEASAALRDELTALSALVV